MKEKDKRRWRRWRVDSGKKKIRKIAVGKKKRNAKGREMRKEGSGRKGEGRQAKRRRKSKEATKEVHEK